MKQQSFIDHVIGVIESDENVVGLAVAGSYITKEIDEYSDVDIILVTRTRIAGNLDEMVKYARSFGHYLNGFTGEHVGEPRVLICLYDHPLLHVDIKFLVPDEFTNRIEDPIIVFDREGMLQKIVNSTKSAWPSLNYQWIEDRFWTWIHYATLKLGRGENFEALDFLSFLRTTVLAPLLQVKNKNLPRGLRKVETNLEPGDLKKLATTVSEYDTASLFRALENCALLYQDLRQELFPPSIQLHKDTEKRSLEYFSEIRKQMLRRS